MMPNTTAIGDGQGKNRGLLLLLATLILFPSLAACSLLPGSEPEPVSLTFVFVSYPGLPDRSAAYEQLAASFHEANPQIDVHVKSVNLEQLPRGLADADFLTDPEWGVDVIMADAALVPPLVERGLLRVLDPALEGDLVLEAADFYAPALDLLRWQGGLYGLPAELDPLVMFYNQDRFDVAGVPYPSGDWRWEGFLTRARALTPSPLSSPSLSPGWAFGSWGAQVTPFVYQNGGRMVDDPQTPGRVTLHEAPTIQAIRWYVDLALLEGVMSTPIELAEYAVSRGREMTILTAGDAANTAASQARADLEQAVNSGTVAMWMGWLSGQGSHWRRWDYDWGVAPLPIGRQAATIARIQGYFITAQSQHFHQALQWVDYMTRQPPLYGGLPARRSVAGEEAFRGQLRPEIQAALDACLGVLESGTVLPESLDGLATQGLQGFLFAILAGELTVEQALEKAQEQLEQTLDDRR